MSNDNRKVDISIFQKPKSGNKCNGDSNFYKETDNNFICALVDGLGSGEYANESAEIVTDVIRKNDRDSLEKLLMKANEQLVGKRGVVIGILQLDFQQETYSFSSIGNIGIMVITKDGKKKRNIPSVGYLSGSKPNFKVMREKLEPSTNFIMFSDGVKDKELTKLNGSCNSTDVTCITKAYEHISEEIRKDDTTLIAIHYHGK